MAKGERMEAGEEFRYLVLALQREGNRQLAEALRPLGLTPSQAEVIEVLAQYPALTLLGLGERLVCENGSPSRLVKSMVEAGWIEKWPNPEDGRAVLLRLTPAALDLLPQLQAVQWAFNVGIGAQFDAAALRATLDLLWPLADNTPSGQALARRKAGK
jgi:DNA-binding MarR family transcriptional regulator